MSEPLRTVNVGLIGLGTVGGGVARLIKSHHDEYLAAYGIDLKLTRACALAWEQAEAAGIEREAFTSDWHDVVSDPAVDIVVELIGGEHPATEIFTTAFEHGKHVVSANKALLGRHVETLAEKARACGVQIKCEASCGGGIPIVSTLEHDLVGNKILTIAGILNGTTNYILSRMDAEGADYADVLADAQAKGYAEADPTADVDGFDAAAKIAILASLAFKSRVTMDDVYCEGIRNISPVDLDAARDMGFSVKLLALAHRSDAGIDVHVHPTMIPLDHQLSKVNGVNNAIYVTGDAVGETMFFGEGAGAGPAAAAVMGDVLEVARHMTLGIPPVVGCTCTDNLPIVSMEKLSTKYYIRFVVADRSGVLAAAADIFAKYDVSVKTVTQRGNAARDDVDLVFVTHTAEERNVRKAIDDILALEGVVTGGFPSVIRVQD